MIVELIGCFNFYSNFAEIFSREVQLQQKPVSTTTRLSVCHHRSSRVQAPTGRLKSTFVESFDNHFCWL